jgi:hypothetical protein
MPNAVVIEHVGFARFVQGKLIDLESVTVGDHDFATPHTDASQGGGGAFLLILVES